MYYIHFVHCTGYSYYITRLYCLFTAGCPGNHAAHCKGCRGILVNASLPESKRLKLPASDRRLRKVLEAIEQRQSTSHLTPVRVHGKRPSKPNAVAVSSQELTVASSSLSALQSTPVSSRKVNSNQILTILNNVDKGRPVVRSVTPQSALQPRLQAGVAGFSRTIISPSNIRTANAVPLSGVVLKKEARKPNPTDIQYVMGTTPDGKKVMVAIKPTTNIRTIGSNFVTSINPSKQPSSLISALPLKVIKSANAPKLNTSVITLPPSTSTATISPKMTSQIISPRAASLLPSPSSGSTGPRVKHVSRSATVVQGERAIISPEQPEPLRLSALPAEEKTKIWQATTKQALSDDEEMTARTGGKTGYRREESPKYREDMCVCLKSDFFLEYPLLLD